MESLLFNTHLIQLKNQKKFDILVSTDSDKIKKLALKNKFYFLGSRPKILSGDRVETKDVLKYELKKIEKLKKKKYKNILLLQATCPFRNPKKIFFALKKVNTKMFDSVISVSKLRQSSFKNEDI